MMRCGEVVSGEEAWIAPPCHLFDVPSFLSFLVFPPYPFYSSFSSVSIACLLIPPMFPLGEWVSCPVVDGPFLVFLCLCLWAGET